ncbi:Saccharopine dehydrogenase [Desulfosarcina cetonica]|uniref:saccharopine dehydrogenase family protein n=1 Tax=Desulfosarcina cetonica TaxID=90730 RepID=UPI0006D1A3C8|nr:saccharopine dehydrogenase NADP-binding domain-containing protein [Desulfosarcina cetonica]VTR70263.1 Saccharopine dehydrogenase [Desulfosarcina cetonica]
MRVLLIGGVGNMGQGVARDLVKQEQVTHIVLTSLHPDPARLSAKLRENEKTSMIKMDVNDHEGMVKALTDIDVVINAAGPFYKTAVPVAKAAVAAHVNYIDICDDYEGTQILFDSEIDQMAKEAGITVLTGMGSDPGTNNVLVKWYADRLDTVEEIYLYWVVSVAELQGAAWDHSLHMTLGKIPQYIDGKLVHVEGGTGVVAEQFLDPLGVCQLRYVGHPQPLTLPKYIKGVKNVIIKGALIPLWVDELIKEQKATGFLGTEPIDVKGAQITPYDLALKLWETIPEGRDNGPQSSGLKVIVKGEREGKKVTYTADMVGRMAPGTGIPASIAALMMAAGDVTVKGVVAPEGCIDPDIFLSAFLSRGARIHQTEHIASMFEINN